MRTVEGGWERNYSVRNLRSLAPCSLEVQDVTRLGSPNNPSVWWVEEDRSVFHGAVRATITAVGGVNRISVKSNTPTIRLERSFSSSNQWNDPSLPRDGNRVEFVPEVIFDLPSGSETNRVFEFLLDAIAQCSRGQSGGIR